MQEPPIFDPTDYPEHDREARFPFVLGLLIGLAVMVPLWACLARAAWSYARSN